MAKRGPLGLPRLTAAGPLVSYDRNYPPGPARRVAQVITEGLEDIEGVQTADTATTGQGWTLDFYMPDQDAHFPSAVSVDTEFGRITEVTLRLGPLGKRDVVDDEELRRLEEQWIDVVLEAASKVDLMGVLGREFADLGDPWVADDVRPHLRLYEKENGYNITPQKFVEFVEVLASQFEQKFGTLEERMFSEEYGDNFSDRPGM